MTKEEFIEKTLQHLGFTKVSPEQATLDFVFDMINTISIRYRDSLERENDAFLSSREDGFRCGMNQVKHTIENDYIAVDKLRQMTLVEISALIMDGE
jgi:hypothetical protein